ncbi:hypothetical protein KCP71_21595 [Salmonella enterica subsp. enterica]|nr:hypothetical protein KCP71_21595 [Salmonella enterica subsp. enterica]
MTRRAAGNGAGAALAMVNALHVMPRLSLLRVATSTLARHVDACRRREI